MTLFIPPTRDFGIVTASTGYDSAATSIVLASGDGSILPAPGSEGAFYMVWWNNSDYASPHIDPLREKIKVTARTGDTLGTIVRGISPTSAQNHNVGGKTYRLLLTPTRETFDLIDGKIAGLTASGFYAYRGTDQTGIVTATETKIQYATENFDIASEYDPTTNHRWTIAKTGFYHAFASMYFLPSAVDGTKWWRIRVKKNTSTEVLSDLQRAVSAEMTMRCSGNLSLTAGDFLEVTIEHNMGSNQTVKGHNALTIFGGYSIYSGT